MKQYGIMQSYYDHRYYIKPSVKNTRKKNVGKFKARIWQQQQDAKNNDYFIN